MTFEVPMQTFQVREESEKTSEVFLFKNSYLSNTDPSSEE
jgi:hypothetical protein